MDSSDPRQAGIVRVKAAATVASPGKNRSTASLSIGAAKEAFNLSPLAYRESRFPPLDKQHPSEKEAVLGAGKAQITLIVFTQTPNFIMADYLQMILILSHPKHLSTGK